MDTEDDFLTQKSNVTEDKIAADAVVKQATMKFVNLSLEVAEKESELKTLKEQLEASNKDITTMLVERGWSVLPLIGGRKLELKETVYARFPKDDLAAQKFIEDHGGGDMIKSSIVVDGQDGDVLEALERLNAEFEKKVDVNTNSLQAFFRRLLGQTKGSVREIEVEDVPESFSLYEKKEVVLK